MKTSDKGKPKLPYLLRNYAAKNMHKSCVSKVEESKKQKIFENLVDSEAESQYYDGYELNDINCLGIEIGIEIGYDEND